ncbi:fimbrial A protein [Serratia marcescens]|nr:fimbrial A protein [Serratia marcescens]
MKLNKIMMAAVIALGMTSAAHAAVQGQGHGKITFNGSIIDAPCSISPETEDQTVELGQISKVALKDSGTSIPRSFSIALENCEFSEDEANKVSVTFSGMESNGKNGLLGLTGTAKGAGVALVDAAGQKIKLGEPTKAQALTNGNNTLNFAAYLQGDGASSAVVEAGDFQAVADFTLAYN